MLAYFDKYAAPFFSHIAREGVVVTEGTCSTSKLLWLHLSLLPCGQLFITPTNWQLIMCLDIPLGFVLQSLKWGRQVRGKTGFSWIFFCLAVCTPRCQFVNHRILDGEVAMYSVCCAIQVFEKEYVYTNHVIRLLNCGSHQSRHIIFLDLWYYVMQFVAEP